MAAGFNCASWKHGRTPAISSRDLAVYAVQQVQLPKGEEAGKELRLRLGDASGASGDQFLTRTGVILLVCERMHLSEQRSASLTRSTVTAGTLLPAKFKQTG